MFDLMIPLLLTGVSLFSLRQKQNVYQDLVDGARDGLETLRSIAPTMVILLTGISMFRASGALTLLEKLLTPLMSRSGIPAELLPLMLIRPFSGSAALAVAADLIAVHGADSLVGRTAAVMLGSTETTFYTIGVYFGAAGIRRTRSTVPAAIAADLTGFFMAALSVRLFFR